MKLALATTDDLLKITEWLKDPKLIYNLMTEQPCLDKPLLIYAIKLDSGETVGWTEVFNIDVTNNKAEAGNAIPDPRGRGLTIRCAKQFQELWFNELKLNRITMRVPEGNTDSIRFLKYLGFRLEGVERQSCFRGGRYEDVMIYARCKDEYEGGGGSASGSTLHNRCCNSRKHDKPDKYQQCPDGSVE